MTNTKTSLRDIPTDAPPERKKAVEMSATQLVGGALAAMTAAVIGAQLGVAGTVLGAALGSIVAGVAGSLYTASLKHTKDKLTSAFVGKVGDTTVELERVEAPPRVPEWGAGSDQTLESVERGYGQTWHWDTAVDADPDPDAAVAPVSTDPVAAEVVVDDRGRQVRQWPWKGILVSTAAAFLLALAAITGFELVSGQSVSGGEGTTIGQVSDGRASGSDTTPSPAPSSTPSASTSSEPSNEPSASSEPTSSATSEPTGEPSEEPSTSSEPSASSEPSVSASASGAADQAGAANDGAGSGDAPAAAGH